jgi:hypothetical protein
MVIAAPTPAKQRWAILKSSEEETQTGSRAETEPQHANTAGTLVVSVKLHYFMKLKHLFQLIKIITSVEKKENTVSL